MGFLDQAVKRVGMAAAYLGVGYAASTINSYKTEGLKSYYGESEYNRRFHGYYETSSNLMMGAGILGAGAALLKSDPISSLISNVKSYPKYKAAYREHTKELSSIARKYNKAGGFGKDIVGPAGPRSFVTSPEANREAYNSAIKEAKQSFRKANPRGAPGSILFRASLAASVLGGMAGYAAGHPEGIALSAGSGTLLLSSRSILRHKKVTALGTIPIAAGAIAAGMRNPYPTAESGNIDAQYDRSSVVSRMNFSTANLVQSLYRNRKAN